MKKIIQYSFLSFFIFISLVGFACSYNHIHSIKMERTACFGKCPWYIIEIFEDGRVTYEGIKDCDRIGYYEGYIDQGDAREMINRFEDRKIKNAQDEYFANIMDVPYLNYTFSLDKNHRSKQIKHANFGPKWLLDLGLEVDDVVKEVLWQSAIKPETSND